VDAGDEYNDTFDQPVAFQVEGASQQSNLEPPADAAEYLRRVRQEASALGPVKRAREIDPNSFKHKQTRYLPTIELAAPCPVHLAPDPEWQEKFSADFSALREALIQLKVDSLSEEPLPGLRDQKSWLYFVLGSNSLDFPHSEPPASSCSSSCSSSSSSSSPATTTASKLSTDSNAAALVNSSGHLPVLSLLHRFDQVTIRMLIELLTDTDFGSTFGYHLCVWLFCLLAYLDKPIDDDMSSVLRTLYRKLARARASQKKEGKVVAYCNLLLTIVHSIFQQSVPSEI